MADTRLRRGTERPCKFCAIAAGKEKACLVFRDAHCAAFLDSRPLALGHVLLVPAAHYRDLSDLPDGLLKELALRVKMLSTAVIAAMAADGSFVALNNRISQSVPHVHFHIVPRHKGDGLFAHRLIWKRVTYRDDAEREQIAGEIRGALPG